MWVVTALSGFLLEHKQCEDVKNALLAGAGESQHLRSQRIQVCSACTSSRVSQGQVPLLSTIMNIKLVFISFST